MTCSTVAKTTFGVSPVWIGTCLDILHISSRDHDGCQHSLPGEAALAGGVIMASESDFLAVSAAQRVCMAMSRLEALPLEATGV